MLSRRDLLKAAAAGAAVSLPGLRHAAFAGDAQAASGDMLLVIFQRGGCDGLSLLAPTNDPDYIADRAPELRVTADGAKPGRALSQSFAPAIDFRLHPEASPLGELYDQRQLALIHAVGLENGTRSHFVAQDLMERGVADASNLKGSPNGWLTRLMAARPTGGMPAIATTPAIPAALAFHAASLAIPDLRGGLALPGGPQPHDVLSALYANAADPFSRAARDTLRDMDVIDSRLPRGPDNKVLPYQAEGNAVYEETEIGRGLQTVARILKMDIGLQTACIDMGGWDHHEHMAGRFSGLAGQLARGLAAFWNDTARYHDRVTVVVMTEFGRRLRTNKSNGTDHGHGGVMMVLGGHVQGGNIYGRWPGLAAAQLDNGVDLAVTTDYRAVLAEVLSVRLHAGSALGKVFPSYAAPKTLGLVRA
jgi:uncharacterized protein (DUF1501 family)